MEVFLICVVSPHSNGAVQIRVADKEALILVQDVGKGVLSLRGWAFITVLAGFDGFCGSRGHLTLLLRALQNTAQRGNRDGFDSFDGFGGFWHWKTTKEYLSHRGTEIRFFRVRFCDLFLTPFFSNSSPLFPLQALSPLLPLFPSSPPPLFPL